ncbi:hypothetical protein H6P81_000929 [Aristolochia fimbriata]|uniref:Survival protein SurE-like phosphatase/nucleotidase domain-containing protein n=1 Tax=Aristolochia fimbriata TaxID=158543 RepID=A0AAV7F9B6_ARIFI|nr:hypothetical protein H6P81_000929 [Aristolochia fimbriata]
MEEKPKILITNDDGIHAAGLRALVQVLVATNQYEVYVSAPDSERSAVGHGILWQASNHATRVEIEGATAYGVQGTPADCASLGVSKALFPGLVPDLVISGINIGANCGYHVVYSGTVAGAREAFLQGFPSLALSYDWVAGKSDVQDFKKGAEACLPLINSVLAESRNKEYPKASFLNINLPTDVNRHKGYKLTKQGKCLINIGWKQITSSIQDGKSAMEITSVAGEELLSSFTPSQIPLTFKREVIGPAKPEEVDTDYGALQQGYISVTPLAALSPASVADQDYYEDWIQRVAESQASSSL